MSSRLATATPWLAVIVLAVAPVVPYGIAGEPLLGLGVSVDVVLAWLVLGRLPSRAHGLLGAAWALLVVYSLVMAGSRVFTEAQLPLGDLVLLLRPLVVIVRDLYGPLAAYGALGTLAAAAMLLVPVARWLWTQAHRAPPPPRLALVGVILVGLLLPGSRLVLVDLARDGWHSWQLAADFRAEVEERATHELQPLTPLRQPHVEVLVVESYGMVAGDLAAAPRWRQALADVGARAQDHGWHVVSGVGVAPVHGGRSWVADASVFSGLEVRHQSDYERVIRRADRMTTLPSWFADHGWTTVLMRQADRARPGVHLQNHFGFQKTVFFDDLDYEGPGVGWGYVPDQFALHRLRGRHLATVGGPHFVFAHLASSHMPWGPTPPIVDDPDSWQRRRGPREWAARRPITPWQSIRLVALRFLPPSRPSHDVAAIQGQYVGLVSYGLRSAVHTLPDPADHPALVVIMGDHQPPFLAREAPPHVPLHVLATDPSLLAPFREAGFAEGWTPDGAPVVAHHDLLPLLVDVVTRP